MVAAKLFLPARVKAWLTAYTLRSSFEVRNFGTDFPKAQTLRLAETKTMIEQVSSHSEIREHIWLVALYEREALAEELLERLSAIGVDTAEATTVRVEIDDQLRRAKFTPMNGDSALSPVVRSAVTGALIGGATALLIGLVFFAFGWFVLPVFAGLFNHSVFFVFIGALIGALIGISLASARQRKSPQAKLPQMKSPSSEGFLVAVKMPPLLAERAEEIARGLGAKEILL